jgi:superfamily II DNA or RNA helicase
MKAICKSGINTKDLEQIRKSLQFPHREGRTFSAFGENESHLWVPRFYEWPGQFPFSTRMFPNYEQISKTAQFTGSPLTHPGQKPVAQCLLSNIQNPLLPVHGCVVQLSKGFGKAFTVMYTILKIRKRTLVILSKNRLAAYTRILDQFVNNLNYTINTWDNLQTADLVILEEPFLQDSETNSAIAPALSAFALAVIDLANELDPILYAKFVNLLQIPRWIGITTNGGGPDPPTGHMDVRPDPQWNLLTMSLGTTIYNAPQGQPWVPCKQTCNLSAMYGIDKTKCTEKELSRIRRELHMKPRVYGHHSEHSTEFRAYVETSTHIYVPRFYGIERFGMPQDSRLSEGVPMSIHARFEGTLTDNPPQKMAVRTALEIIRGQPVSGMILQLPCGFGKTVLSLYIAAEYGRRTLVLVHKDDLLEQWRERIEQFIPRARVGRIQRDVQDVADRDIVLGMVQSLAGKEYDRALLATIGLVIVDEAHHMAAKYFSSALNKLPAAHIVGLSATPRRKDGLDHMLRWTVGPVQFQAERSFELVVVRQLVYTGGREKEIRMKTGDPVLMRMITMLTHETRRNMLIIALIRRIVGLGRNLLVLSHIVEHLKYLERYLLDHHITDDVGIYVGARSKKEKERNQSSKNKSVILATVRMAKEALDIPKLDTLILATPQGDVEQDIGRILRPFPTKQTPTVFDIVDPFSTFFHLANKRLAFVSNLEYDVQRMDAEEYISF